MGSQSFNCTTAIDPSVRIKSPVAFWVVVTLRECDTYLTDSTHPAKFKSRTTLARSSSMSGSIWCTKFLYFTDSTALVSRVHELNQTESVVSSGDHFQMR